MQESKSKTEAQKIKELEAKVKELETKLAEERSSNDEKATIMKQTIAETEELASNLQNTTLALVQERQIALAKAEKEKLLNRWIERINSSFDLEGTLAASTFEMGQYLKASRCGIILLDAQGLTVSEFCQKNYRRDQEELKQAKQILRKNHYIQKVIESKLMLQEHVGEQQDIFTQGVSSVLMVPLMLHEQVMGILYLQQCGRERVWNEREVDLLVATSVPLTTAIEKARLYKKTKERQDHAELFSRLTTQIRGSLNLEEILARTVNELGIALNASRCFLFFDGHVSEEYCRNGIASIASDAQSLILDKLSVDKGQTIVVNDITAVFTKLTKDEQQNLRKTGAISALATPLYFQNILQGWIVLHSLEERQWTDDEIKFVESVASQVIVAMTQSKMYEKLDSYQEKLSRELKQAARVQTSLIGGDVFDAELETSVFYKAHSNVSGDFYSVAELSPHHIGVLIGDVSGKGPAAALLTGYLLGEFNSVVRNSSLAWYPDKMINFLCRSILYQNESSDFYATAWYGIFDISNQEVRYSNGGHLNPYFIDAKTGLVTLLDENKDAGVPLGLLDPKELEEYYECRTVSLKQGDKMLLFTDGIMDQKMPGGDFVPKDWVRKSLEQLKTREVKEITYELNEYLNEMSGVAPLTDDRLMICIEQKHHSIQEIEIQNNDICNAYIARIVQECMAAGMPNERALSLRLGLTEALTNAVRYGLEKNPYGTVRLGYMVSTTGFKISILDPGPGFNWQVYSNTFIDEVRFEDEGGRGIPLLREIFDKVTWNPFGNHVGLFYYW